MTDVPQEVLAFVAASPHRRYAEWLAEDDPERPQRIARLLQLATAAPDPALSVPAAPNPRMEILSAAKLCPWGSKLGGCGCDTGSLRTCAKFYMATVALSECYRCVGNERNGPSV